MKKEKRFCNAAPVLSAWFVLLFTHGCGPHKDGSVECTEGNCCAETGFFKPRTETCGQRVEKRCSSDQCGATVQTRLVIKYCSGDKATCEGDENPLAWEDLDTCDAITQACVYDKENLTDARCVACGEHLECKEGKCDTCLPQEPCCNEQGHYETDEKECRTWQEHQCSNDNTCGATPQYRVAFQYCTGDRADCVGGKVIRTDWQNKDSGPCDSTTQACVDDESLTFSHCDDCGNFAVCESGACTCLYSEECSDGCCNDGETCRFNDLCGLPEMPIAPPFQQEGQFFGHSVSIDSDWAVVGAYGYQVDAKPKVGATAIYKLTDNAWEQADFITVDDGAVEDEGDRFGYSVSLSGNVLLIGAPRWDDPNPGGNPMPNAGAVYVFELEEDSWEQKDPLDNEETSDVTAYQFGYSVSLDGNTALVGSTGALELGVHWGGAYVFIRESGAWKKEQKLSLLDAQEVPELGPTSTLVVSVSLKENRAIVGTVRSYFFDDDSIKYYGAAYVFERDNGVWTRKTLSNEKVDGDYFGISVSIDGDVAMVGASRRKQGDDEDRAGAVYFYNYNNQTEKWDLAYEIVPEKLDDTDNRENYRFGYSVALRGQYAYVGATRYTGADPIESPPGFVRVYKYESSQWELHTTFQADGETQGNRFGRSVAADDWRLIVGADYTERFGKAYTY